MSRLLLPLLLLLITPVAGAGELPLGINLDFHASWSRQLLFKDALLQARPWFASDAQQWQEWASGVEVPLDPLGYPLEVPFTPTSTPTGTPAAGRAQIVRSVLLDGQEGHYPGGEWTLLFQGQGRIRLLWDAGEREFDHAGEYPVTVTPSDRGVLLEILASRRDDPIRDLHFVMPGHAGDFRARPFNPQLLERLKPFRVIRTMAAQNINEGRHPCDNGRSGGEAAADPACTVGWSNRTRPDYVTQAVPTGIAVEHLIDLANTLGSDLWLCVVHAADDDYMRQLAERVKWRLRPDLKLYLELSNEAWNAAPPFPQSRWFAARGEALGLDPRDAGGSGRAYFVQRSARLFTLFEEIFGKQRERLVKVLPAWSANPWYGAELVRLMGDPRLNPEGVHADALAIAPYVGGRLADTLHARGEVTATTPERLLEMAIEGIDQERGAKGDSPPSLRSQIRDHAAIARGAGLRLIAYEGGQHLAGNGAAMEDAALTTLLTQANRHPLMGELYRRLLTAWREEGGGLFTAFSLVGSYGKFGSWGILEHLDQPPSQAPKYHALLEAATAASPRAAPPPHPARPGREGFPDTAVATAAPQEAGLEKSTGRPPLTRWLLLLVWLLTLLLLALLVTLLVMVLRERTPPKTQ